jgi:integrase-like protein
MLRRSTGESSPPTFRSFWCCSKGRLRLVCRFCASCTGSSPLIRPNVAAIVKQGAARPGFDPSTFGGHSLRAGFVTSAVKRGANLIKITDVTGHRSLEMLKTYSRDAETFVAHAGAGLL